MQSKLPMHLSPSDVVEREHGTGKPCRSPAMPTRASPDARRTVPGPPKGNKNALKHGLCDGGDCWAAEITALLRSMSRAGWIFSHGAAGGGRTGV